jgi:hypothetical protein
VREKSGIRQSKNENRDRGKAQKERNSQTFKCSEPSQAQTFRKPLPTITENSKEIFYKTRRQEKDDERLEVSRLGESRPHGRF